MSILLALIAIKSPVANDDRISRMAALYEQVCLRTFPDDKAVETLMTTESARELTPEEVKVTMRDDPARGWMLKDGNATAWLEYPPYHACSVRWSASQIGDLRPYQHVEDRYKTASPGFEAMEPMDGDQGSLHIHGTGIFRTLADQSRETLFIIDQHINDPKRRAAGETGVSLRFVHQFAPPAPANR